MFATKEELSKHLIDAHETKASGRRMGPGRARHDRNATRGD